MVFIKTIFCQAEIHPLEIPFSKKNKKKHNLNKGVKCKAFHGSFNFEDPLHCDQGLQGGCSNNAAMSINHNLPCLPTSGLTWPHLFHGWTFFPENNTLGTCNALNWSEKGQFQNICIFPSIEVKKVSFKKFTFSIKPYHCWVSNTNSIVGILSGDCRKGNWSDWNRNCNIFYGQFITKNFDGKMAVPKTKRWRSIFWEAGPELNLNVCAWLVFSLFCFQKKAYEID